MKNLANPPKVLKRSPSDEADGEPASAEEIAASMVLQPTAAAGAGAHSEPVGDSAAASAGGRFPVPLSSGPASAVQVLQFPGGVRLCLPHQVLGSAVEEVESATDVDSQTLEASLAGGAEPHDGDH